MQFCNFNTTGVLNKTEKKKKKKQQQQNNNNNNNKNGQNLGNLIQTVPQKGCSVLQSTVPDKPYGFCGRSTPCLLNFQKEPVPSLYTLFTHSLNLQKWTENSGFSNLKQNKVQSACAESMNKRVN